MAFNVLSILHAVGGIAMTTVVWLQAMPSLLNITWTA